MKIGLIIYGSLENLSGGYLYDRKVVEFLQAAGDQVEIVPLPWRNYPRHLLDNFDPDLIARLACIAPDVILEDELNHPSLFLANRRLRARVNAPLVSIVHHLRASEEHPAWVRPLYRWVEGRYLASVDSFVFNSQTTRASVAALLGGPAPGIVAHPAADHLPLPSRTETDRLIAARQERTGPMEILFVGNVIPRKGLHLLLDALTQLDPDRWRLHVVGAHNVDSAYAARLERRIDALGLTHHVILWGRLPDQDLVLRYQEADVLAVPSYEGFGIVYLEAMAFGVPVLASTAGAAGELVLHGEHGFLTDPRDVDALASHLARLLADAPLRAAMGRRARRRFERHPTWRQTAARIREHLEEISQRGRAL